MESKKLNIVFASHTFMGGPFVVGSHHLARELSLKGHNVFHISTPLTPFHLKNIKSDEIVRFRFKKYGIKPVHKVSANLKDISYMTLFPWRIACGIYLKTEKNPTLFGLKSIKKKVEIENIDVLLIDQPAFVGIEKILNPKITIYRSTDLSAEMTGDQRINYLEKQILNKANGIIGTSQPVIEHLTNLNSKLPYLLLENGVDFNHFKLKSNSNQKNDNEKKGTSIIYVGALDERFDYDAINYISEQEIDVKISIIGPIDNNKKRKFKENNKIRILGAKDYKDIPKFLHDADIAILPLSDHPSNDGRSPMKLYEYGAAGLPVIVRSTKELKRRDSKNIYLYDEIQEIPKIIDIINSKNQNKLQISNGNIEYSWEKKAERLLEFLQKL